MSLGDRSFFCRRRAPASRLPRLATCLAAFTALVAAAPLRAQVVTWLGGTGNWSTALLWTPALVPASGASVSIDGGNLLNSSVTLDVTATVSQLAIGSGDALTIANNRTLIFAGTTGTLANDGTLALGSVGNLTDLIISGGAFTFTTAGAGVVNLSNSTANRIYGSGPGAALTNAAGHTIQGSGQLGVGLLAITNHGLISANQSSGLFLQPNTAGFTNLGTLRATSGATLTLQSGTFTNTGATIEALTGSTVRFESANVSGGTLSTSGTGRLLNAIHSTFRDLTLAPGSVFDVPNNTVVTFGGAFSNQGTVNLNSVGNLTDFIAAGPTLTLSGGGLVFLSNTGANRIYGDTTTTTLVNLDNTIRGSGQLGVNTLQLDNRGTIEAHHAGGTLTIDPSGSGALNSGTLQALNGATLSLAQGTFDNTGGTIRAHAGSTVRVDSAAVTGGTFDVSGTLAFDAASINGAVFTTAAAGLITTVGGASTLDGPVTINAGLQLNLANNTSLKLLASGTYTHHGALTLSSVGNLTDLILVGGDVVLGGTGTITLGNNGNNRIYGLAASDRLVLGSGLTLRGGGQLGVNLMGLTNHGTIEANVPTDLVIDPSGAHAVNTATLRAVSGATLRLTDGTYTNSGGTISALDASRVLFQHASIFGGTLSSAGTGRLVNAADSSFNSVTLSAGSILDIANNTPARFAGTFTNQGTVNLGSVGNLTDFIAEGGVLTLAGGGTLQLGANGNNRIYGPNTTATLVNQDNTIRGAGQLGVGQLQLDNRATIESSFNGGTLTLATSGTGTRNTGILQAINGATLLIAGSTIDNNGGTLRADTGSRVDLSFSTITGGTLTTIGTGVIRTISSGNTLGGALHLTSGSQLTLNNNTNLTLLASGLYTNHGTISLNSVGNFTDLLLSGGDVTLAGTGTIALGHNTNNRIYGTASTDRLVNPVGHTVQGAGQLGVGLMGLVNQGLVRATFASPLTVSPSAAGVTNTGRLRAEAGSLLRLEHGAFNNTGGIIEANGAGSLVAFDHADVSFGQLLAANGGLLRNTANSTFTDVSLGLGATLQIPNNTSATFGGTLTSQGTVTLNSVGNFTNLLVATAGLTLVHGTIDLGANFNNRIYSPAGTATLVNESATLQGAGQIGVGLTALDNRGTIDASLAGQTLLLAPNATGALNTGLLTATNGGILRLSGAFTNTGGNIVGGTGSRVDLDSATITGGLLGGSLFRNLASSTLSSLGIGTGTRIEVANNTALTLLGTIGNSGTLALTSVGNATDLLIGAGGVTLIGGGAIELSNNGSNRLYGATAATTLDNVNNTIRGSGQLGLDQLTLKNTGTIEASQSTPLTVNLSGATVFTNQGQLRAINGGTLLFADAFTNTGVVTAHPASTVQTLGAYTQTAGVTVLRGGTFGAASSSLQGGALVGSGTVNGAVTNSALIAPGAAGSAADLGLLTFNHALTLTSTSLLHFELGGVADFDRIIAPSAAIGGLLVVTFTNGFASTILPTDTFTLLSTTSMTGLTGTFAHVGQGLRLFTGDGAGSFQVNYLANAVTLSNFQAIPEPSTYVLLGLGAGALFLSLRRRRSR